MGIIVIVSIIGMVIWQCITYQPPQTEMIDPSAQGLGYAVGIGLAVLIGWGVLDK